MSTTRTIGHISEHGSEKGVLYTQVFFVLDSDKASYTPTYKQDGSDSPFGFKANTYIYDWKIVGVSDHWLITVEACDDDYDWGDEDDSAMSGCINEQMTQDGIKYQATYHVKPVDKQTYTPTYGQDGNSAPFGFPSGTYIYEYKIESNTKQIDDDEIDTTCGLKSYDITVYACNYDYNWHAEVSRIGQMSTTGGVSGNQYTYSYLITDSEKSTYTPIWGQDGNSLPFGFPSSTYIYEWDFQPIYTNPIVSTEVAGYTDVTSNAPSHWRVKIKACDYDYDWGTGANRVGNIASSTSDKGTKYTATYFIPDSSKVAYTPTLNQDGDDNPFNLPANTYIYEWKFDPVYTNPAHESNIGGKTNVTTDLPAHWILVVYGCDDDYDWGDPKPDDDYPDDEDRVTQSFGITQIFFPIEWFGICHWKNHKWYAQVQADMKDTDKVYSLKAKPVPLALDSSLDASGPDDLVFINAVGELPGVNSGSSPSDPSMPTPSAGSAVASETAKSIWVDTNKMLAHLDWAGTNVTTVSYTVSFYQAGTKVPESYIEWAGVNGVFTPPAGCAPTGYTADGTWRSVKQKVLPNSRKFNNAWHTYVERIMEKAPEDLTFKANGPNGPVWDW